MDIKQLKYFRTIATEGTISAAANKLFISQPSLSQQLQQLENELGVKLVKRSNRRITLTEAGQLLNERAAHVLEFLNLTAEEVKELHLGYKGTLSIGAIASSGVTLLPKLLREFNCKYPHIKLQLYEGDTARILDLLNTGLIDIGIVRTVFETERFDWAALPDEAMIIAMPLRWAHIFPQNSLRMDALIDKPLLIHRSNEAMLVDCCQSFAFQPYIRCKGDDIRTLLVLAQEGVGMALVPESAIGLIPDADLIYKYITGNPLILKKSFIWPRNRYISSCTRYFIETFVAFQADNQQKS